MPGHLNSIYEAEFPVFWSCGQVRSGLGFAQNQISGFSKWRPFRFFASAKEVKLTAMEHHFYLQLVLVFRRLRRLAVVLFVSLAFLSFSAAQTPWQVLEVSEDATPAELSAARRKLALKYRAGAGINENSNTVAGWKLLRINEAYNTARNPTPLAMESWYRNFGGGSRQSPLTSQSSATNSSHDTQQRRPKKPSRFSKEYFLDYHSLDELERVEQLDYFPDRETLVRFLEVQLPMTPGDQIFEVHEFLVDIERLYFSRGEDLPIAKIISGLLESRVNRLYQTLEVRHSQTAIMELRRTIRLLVNLLSQQKAPGAHRELLRLKYSFLLHTRISPVFGDMAAVIDENLKQWDNHHPDHRSHMCFKAFIPMGVFLGQLFKSRVDK
jgi:curved DNA-binding protein CbpA